MPHSESPEGAAVPAPSILLVDDTAENLRLLAGMLATHGFDTRPVTSGAEALEAVAHEAPDLILLDVTMPGMNGFEVCAQLKATPASREIPVIFLTALTGVQDKLDGFNAGGVDFITKPFHLEEVIARVTTQVALKRSREALAQSLARLQELERSRDDLVKMIVHDMRGLLMVVLANLDLARGEISGEAAEDVDSAIKAAQAVTQMSNTLLDVSRLEEGKMPLSLELGDLVSVAQESGEMLRALDSSRTITIDSAGAVMAKCDRSLIRRVIDNLVSNAVKHTPSGGRVTIRAQRRTARCPRRGERQRGRGSGRTSRQALREIRRRSHAESEGRSLCRARTRVLQARGGGARRDDRRRGGDAARQHFHIRTSLRRVVISPFAYSSSMSMTAVAAYAAAHWYGSDEPVFHGR